ncbi:hypothetical protein T01_4542 [Trichinella spiralis]|uniref:Uncharacterized protein n=1 Tax=Trichinella spiralis TaxID=6334 RepID=A0A0V0Z5H5_TRISP|nr:hypothetical protein T01_4542 [Trichinella spiralis]
MEMIFSIYDCQYLLIPDSLSYTFVIEHLNDTRNYAF